MEAKVWEVLNAGLLCSLPIESGLSCSQHMDAFTNKQTPPNLNVQSCALEFHCISTIDGLIGQAWAQSPASFPPPEVRLAQNPTF